MVNKNIIDIILRDWLQADERLYIMFIVLFFVETILFQSSVERSVADA